MFNRSAFIKLRGQANETIIVAVDTIAFVGKSPELLGAQVVLKQGMALNVKDSGEDIWAMLEPAKGAH